MTHLKDNLSDASLIRNENQKVFAKLNEVAEVAEQRQSISHATYISIISCYKLTSFLSRVTNSDA